MAQEEDDRYQARITAATAGIAKIVQITDGAFGDPLDTPKAVELWKFMMDKMFDGYIFI